MKKLILILLLLSFSAFAAVTPSPNNVTGGTSNGAPNVSIATGTLPVANGGTGQNYAGIQNIARQSYPKGTPTIPAVYAYPPTITNSTSNSISSNNFAPEATAQPSSFVTSSSTTSGNTLNFSSSFTPYILPGMPVTHIKPPGSSNIPANTYVGTVTSTTVTLLSSASCSNPVAVNVTGTVGSGDNIGFGPVVINRMGFYPGDATNGFSWRNYGGQQEGPRNIINGTNGNNATFLGVPHADEFVYTGTGFTVDYDCEVTNGALFWVFVDGQPSTPDGIAQTCSAGARNFLYVNFNNAGDSQVRRRLIRVYSNNATIYGIHYGNTESVSPNSQVYVRPYWLGDSETAYGVTGTNVGSVFQSIPQLLSLKLGWAAPYVGGEGGTGYTTGGGSGTAFTDSGRLGIIPYINPSLIIDQGSSNDVSAGSVAAVQTAANTVYTTQKAAMPNTPIIVIGVPPLGGGATTGDTTANTGVLAAASALNLPIIDSYDQGWITGTGTAASATGVGNGDIMLTTGGVHNTLLGTDFISSQEAYQIMNMY